MALEKFGIEISEETAEEPYQKYLFENISDLIKHNLSIDVNIGSRLRVEMIRI